MFGGGGGSSRPAPPPVTPPAPTVEDPAVQEAVGQAMRSSRLRRGRAATVLAGGLGDGMLASATTPTTTLGGDRR